MKRMIKPFENDSKVYILRGTYAHEWGIVKDYDGEYYHVALWGDSDALLIFEQDELQLIK